MAAMAVDAEAKRERDEPAAEEPAAKRARAEEGDAALEVNLSRDEAAWLSEDGGSRTRRLEELAGAKVVVSEGGLVKVSDASEAAWAKECVRAVAALSSGRTMKAPVIEVGHALLSVVDVPKDDAKGFVLGREGARLRQFSDELDTVPVFAEPMPKEPASAEPPVIEVGSLLEALYKDKGEWFEVRVEEVVSDEKVKAKWTYDEELPAEELEKKELRAPVKPSEDQDSALEVGAVVEAKYDDYFCKARVLEVKGDKVKVQWTYDESAEPQEVAKSDLKLPPKLATEQLRIYGRDARARMATALKVYNLVEGKVPGFIRPKVSAEDEQGLGWSLVPLIKDGELKAKVVGKGGSVRMKIGKACGSSLEYLANSACIVGTADERGQTAALLELVQTSDQGGVPSVPEVLEPICTRVAVPSDAAPVVIGKKRATMNELEDETGVLSFWIPTEKAPEDKDESKEPMKLEKDMVVECKYGKDQWFEATILEVEGDEVGSRTLKVSWNYDPEEKSDVAEKDAREVLTGEAKAARDATETSSEVRTLGIFGPLRSRTAAELRVMATIESKCPGTYAKDESKGDREVLRFEEAEATRVADGRLQRASTAAGCLLQKVGSAVYAVGGSEADRALGKDYARWLAAETPVVSDASSREDVEALLVPSGKVANLPEAVTSDVEKASGTFILFDNGATQMGIEDSRRLLVCGGDAKKRMEALAKLKKLQDVKPQAPWGEGSWDSWDKGWGEEKKAEKKIVYVTDKAEEERRRKRAERFK